ncbi:tail protein [Staphylococcus phage Alsa_2]|nr:tail protein [Staphylococcus phage Alsa_2]
MNDNLIGIYIGDSKFMTIAGKFPMDKESTLDVYSLEDSQWWVRFNGRVLRLKEDVYDE